MPTPPTPSPAVLAPLVDHLRRHALRTDGPFVLASGAVSDWYLDARRTTFDGEGARLVGEAVASVLHDDVDVVGGMTMGADPIAVATAIVATGDGRPLRAFSVRKEPKDHGTGGRLVGPVTPGDRACVLEDTTTTGAALVEAVDALEAAGVPVVQAVALVDRSGETVAALLADRGIPYLPLIRPVDLGIGA